MGIVEKIIAHLNRNVLGQAAIDHLRKVKNGEVLVMEAISQHNAIIALKEQEAGTAFCKDF